MDTQFADSTLASTNPAAATPPGETTLERNWLSIALRSLIAFAFGLAAVLLPEATLASLMLLFAVYAAVDGVLAMVAGLRAAGRGGRWLTLIFEGIVALAIAALTAFWPALTVLSLILWLAAWAAVSGVLRLVAATRLPRDRGRGWLVLAGLLSIVWAAALVYAPATGAVALVWLIGAYSLGLGVVLGALAIRLARSAPRKVQAPPMPA